MARARIFKLTLTELEVLALAGSKFPQAENPGLLDKLLSVAFESAQEKLNEIAVNEILPKDHPDDEYDNPPTLALEEVKTEPEPVKEETKKEETKNSKKTAFVPGLD